MYGLQRGPNPPCSGGLLFLFRINWLVLLLPLTEGLLAYHGGDRQQGRADKSFWQKSREYSALSGMTPVVIALKKPT